MPSPACFLNKMIDNPLPAGPHSILLDQHQSQGWKESGAQRHQGRVCRKHRYFQRFITDNCYWTVGPKRAERHYRLECCSGFAHFLFAFTDPHPTPFHSHFTHLQSCSMTGETTTSSGRSNKNWLCQESFATIPTMNSNSKTLRSNTRVIMESTSS